MGDAMSNGVDHVIDFWSRFAEQSRVEVEGLGLTAEQAADCLLSAAIGAKLQISGAQATAGMLLRLASLTIQQVPVREDAVPAAAESDSNATKH